MPRALSVAELRAVAASNEFGLDLLSRMADTFPDSTVFISPLSAAIALGMTMNGASSHTFDEMRSTLRLDDLSEEEINGAYMDLLDLLLALDPNVTLRVANSIWYESSYTLAAGFRDRVESTFRAAIRPLDEHNPKDAIDEWVREATGGNIDEIAPTLIPENVVALLINAVHFQADWSGPFDPDKTEPAPFHLQDGSSAPVQLMYRDAPTPVHGTQTYVAADLPYAREAFSMTVVVPRGETTVREVLAELAEGGWSKLVDRLRGSDAVVEVPRFELEWQGDLDDALIAMGMESAFDADDADFSRMVDPLPPRGPWIAKVSQKTLLRVDEEGTEAAAVTVVVTEADMAPLGPEHVRADRPFLLAIRERLSGTVLFLAAIVQPPVD